MVNLKWLDLSFNQIEKIEGLDTLVKLTDLSLCSNKIREVNGGLDNLLELNVLSLSKNLIEKYDDTVIYLRNIPNKLEVLTLNDNPCSDPNTKKVNLQDYQYFVVSYLHNLRYLDYQVIDVQTREQASEKHRAEIDEKDNLKQAEKNDEAAQELSAERLEELKEAMIECTDDIFMRVLEEDENHHKVVPFPYYKEIVQNFDMGSKDYTNDYQEKIIRLHKEKKETILYCKKVLKDAEIKTEENAIDLADAFNKKHKNLR